MAAPTPYSNPAVQEAAWTAAAIRGSRPDFERLVRATARFVYAELVLLTRDANLAEDLAQETYLRAWRSIGALSDPTRFRPWLEALARAAAYDAYRGSTRKKRGSPVQFLHDPPDRSAPPEQKVEQAESCDRALAALANLPSPHRQALTLRYLHDLGRAQITRDLGLTEGALRGVLARGLTMLREALAEAGDPQRSPT